MEPLLQPSSRNEPAESKDKTGTRSCICQCCVMACHTPIFPDEDKATNWLPMKKRYSTRTFRLNVPMSDLFPPSCMLHSRIWLPYEMAIILLGIGSAVDVFTLELIAMRSMAASMCGEVNTCCQPFESLTR